MIDQDLNAIIAANVTYMLPILRNTNFHIKIK